MIQACAATSFQQRVQCDDVNKLSFVFQSRGANVSVARLIAAAVAAERDITVAVLDEIKVAVSEAVSNAIMHGYQNDSEQYVEMSIALLERELVITVRDEGIGIADLEAAMEPGLQREDGHMGLGFAFMKSFMDSVEVDSRPGFGTAVTMRKMLP